MFTERRSAVAGRVGLGSRDLSKRYAGTYAEWENALLGKAN